MFNSICGILTGKTTESIYVETGGIEWEILVSTLNIEQFGTEGETVKVYVWLYHREDQMRLFGFKTPEERSLFFDLTKVDGIGPKQAIKILSGLAASALEAALDAGDVTRLQTIPGIGKKTAQKMVLALKGQLTVTSQTQRQQTLKKSEFEDIIIALVEMGYDRKRVAETVETAVQLFREKGEDPAAKEQELFRYAIVQLST